MEGILLINKPKDFTSHDVVAKMRGILSTKKIGHGGTLDPMATGVLPLFIGLATRAVDMQFDQSKCYKATFRLGITTDTQDITGTVLETRPVMVGERDVRQMLEEFTGELEQIPPMYSAVKIDGKRLYQLARAGREIKRPARPITIYKNELLEVEKTRQDYTILVHCSAGTYIRTLCHDMGEMLGTGATLTQLVRTQAGIFSLEQCHTIEGVENAVKEGHVQELLLPVESLFSTLPKLHTTARQATHIFNGVRMTLSQFPLPADGAQWAIYAPGNVFIGVGVADETTGMLQLEKRFVREVTW